MPCRVWFLCIDENGFSQAFRILSSGLRDTDLHVETTGNRVFLFLTPRTELTDRPRESRNGGCVHTQAGAGGHRCQIPWGWSYRLLGIIHTGLDHNLRSSVGAAQPQPPPYLPLRQSFTEPELTDCWTGWPQIHSHRLTTTIPISHQYQRSKGP